MNNLKLHFNCLHAVRFTVDLSCFDMCTEYTGDSHARAISVTVTEELHDEEMYSLWWKYDDERAEQRDERRKWKKKLYSRKSMTKIRKKNSRTRHSVPRPDKIIIMHHSNIKRQRGKEQKAENIIFMICHIRDMLINYDGPIHSHT